MTDKTNIMPCSITDGPQYDDQFDEAEKPDDLESMRYWVENHLLRGRDDFDALLDAQEDTIAVFSPRELELALVGWDGGAELPAALLDYMRRLRKIYILFAHQRINDPLNAALAGIAVSGLGKEQAE